MLEKRVLMIELKTWAKQRVKRARGGWRAIGTTAARLYFMEVAPAAKKDQ